MTDLSPPTYCVAELPIAPSTTVGYLDPQHQENRTIYICGKPLPCPDHTPVDQCPDCNLTGRYEGRVLIGGRGVYICPEGHQWQDAREKPSSKGIPLSRGDDG